MKDEVNIITQQKRLDFLRSLQTSHVKTSQAVIGDTNVQGSENTLSFLSQTLYHKLGLIYFFFFYLTAITDL